MTTTAAKLNDELATAADNEAGLGALRTERGCLPLVALDVEARIAGVLAETRVRQTFRNALDEPLEATYIFPLPDRAAVSKFELRVAGRTIVGDLKERGQAREDYKRAIDQGHRAAIAEEERSGVFTLRVGNLPPRETATIDLTLVGPLPVADGEATFRFPLVVAPRYTPGVLLDGPSVGDGTTPDTDEVPDASRVTPPVLLPGFPNPVRLSLSVQLEPAASVADAAAWAKQIRSSLHSIVSEEASPVVVRLQPGERLNRDFILRFPVAGTQLATGLDVTPAKSEQPGVFALTLLPPQLPAGAVPTPRDVVFVLDRSGSMQGWKMVAARRALGRILDTLGDRDRFTVIAFDTVAEHPVHTSNQLVAGTNRERWQMLEWLGKIDARGGTEMRPALVAAVRKFDDPARDRVLVIVTDGQVTGEDAVLRELTQLAGAKLPRIFTVGVDQAVNAGFLQRLADVGHGACELVESEERLDAAMDRIHRLIAAPLLTDVRLEPMNFDGLEKSLAPQRIGDLFADRPITVFGRHWVSDAPLRLRIHGTDATGNPWACEVVGRAAGSEAMLLNLWGRAKVRDLEDQYAAGTSRDLKKLAKEIVAVSLESHVLSRFTAYIAVDRAEVINAGGEQAKIVQPVEMPEGWSDATRFCASMPMSPAGATRGIAVFGMAEASGKRRALRKQSNAAPEKKLLHDAVVKLDSPKSADDSLLASEQMSAPAPASKSNVLTSMAGLSPEFIAKWIDYVLHGAITLGATQIRIEPQANEIALSYLIEEQWAEMETPLASFKEPILQELERMARFEATTRGESRHAVVSRTLTNRVVQLEISSTAGTYGPVFAIRFTTALETVATAKPIAEKRERFWS